MNSALTRIFLGLGVALALLTGYGLYAVAQRSEEAAAAPATAATTPLLVARVDIPARAIVTGEMLARQDYPRALVPSTAAASEADVVGRTTLTPIAAGQPFTRPALADAQGRTGASLTIEPGKVLVAFPTTDPLTAAGLISVGDRVDILASVAASDAAKATQTILQNLEVVDVLRATSNGGSSGASQAAGPTSLTFVVDHQVALVLKYLRDSQATIDVAIRSHAEVQLARTISVDQQYLRETYGIRR